MPKFDKLHSWLNYVYDCLGFRLIVDKKATTVMLGIH
jgi:hypothetical protein